MERRECLTLLGALIGVKIGVARPFNKWDPDFLAHDMASFYNLPFEEAFTKLQAGITSDIEPLRRLGIMDLSTGFDLGRQALQAEIVALDDAYVGSDGS